MKRILLVILSETRGGAEEHVRLLAKGLTKEGWQVAVASPSQHLRCKLADSNVKSFHVPPSVDSFRCLPKIIGEFRPAIIHSHLLNATLPCLARRLFRTRAKLVSTLHNRLKYPNMSHVRRSAMPFLARLCVEDSDFVITVSDALRSEIISLPGVDRRKVITIHNGIDFEELDSLAALDCVCDIPKGLAIGSIGRLEVQKGHECLLRALPEIFSMFPHACCYIAGDGPLRNVLMRLASDLGIAEKVHFVGHLENPFAFIRQLDLVVFPSLSEGLPLAHLEAAALGKPIVATSVGGVPEIIQNNKTGILIAPNSPEAIVRAVRHICCSEGLWVRLGSQANEAVRGEFSISMLVRRVSQLYDFLIENT